jgi:hypothetical protein
MYLVVQALHVKGCATLLGLGLCLGRLGFLGLCLCLCLGLRACAWAWTWAWDQEALVHHSDHFPETQHTISSRWYPVALLANLLLPAALLS